MDEYRVTLSPEAESNPAEAIQFLIEAVDEISNASEKNFNELKNTKWYSRLWKMVTFSKDHEKMLAQGVSSLAKLQEIVVKALLLLSQQSEKSAEIISEHADSISRLSQNVASLAKIQNAFYDEIYRLKNGIKKTIELGDITGDKKQVFFFAFSTVANALNNDSSLCQSFYKNVYNGLNCSPQDYQDTINVESIETLNNKEALLLYQVIMEYVYLATDNFECISGIMDYLPVSDKNKAAIRSLISDLVKRGGKEILIGAHDSTDYSFVEAYDIEWAVSATEETQKQWPFKENAQKIEEENCSSQTSVSPISTISALICNNFYEIFSRENTKDKKGSNSKRRDAFLAKYELPVEKKTIIAYAEGFIGSAKFLFTTNALYYYGGPFNNLEKIKYMDIDAPKCIYEMKGGSEATAAQIHIARKSNAEPIIVSQVDITNIKGLLQLLCQLAALDFEIPDTAQSLEECSEEIKFSHSTLILLFSYANELSIIEALRIASDLFGEPDQFQTFLRYNLTRLHSQKNDFSQMLEQEIKKYLSLLPYPSEERLEIQTFHNAIRLLQYSTGKCREFTLAQLQALEKLAEALGIEQKNFEREIEIAQISYRIIQNDATHRDYQKLSKLAKNSTILNIASMMAIGIPATILKELARNKINRDKIRMNICDAASKSYMHLYSFFNLPNGAQEDMRKAVIERAKFNNITIKENNK